MAVRFLPLLPGDPTEIATYVLRARLGSGGMGTVYLSFSPGRRPVAIKVVKREFADDPEFRRRFRREIEAAQRVQGVFTAPVVDADPDAPVPWLATAYIPGPSLQNAVAEHGPFPLFAVFRLLAGAAEGIAAVHAAGLIHRDLKPANVLLAQDGPRVIDFGIVHAANSSTLTQGYAIGTPGFMSPEQIRGGKVTEATDVFALGQLAVYAVTGESAFGEGTTDALFYRIINEPPSLGSCPPELRPIVERCLAKVPADRPSVGEVIDYARNAMHGDTMRVLDEPWLPPPVVATLRDYSPTSAPPPPTVSAAPAAPAAPTAPPSTAPATERAGSGSARASGRKRILRPIITIPAALILIAGGYLGYEIRGVFATGNTGQPQGNHGSTQSTTATQSQVATTPTALAASTSTTPTTPAASPATTATTSTGSDTGYVPNYANHQFTMPGGGCTQYTQYTAASVYLGPQAPVVSVNNDVSLPYDDLDINCGGGPGNATVLEHDRDQMAVVSGSPGAAACDAAVTTSPLSGNQILFTQLKNGEQFCLLTASGGQVALLTLVSKSAGSYDLTWTATAWSIPTTS